MALLPAPRTLDASRGFEAYRQGYTIGQDQRRNALLSEAGHIASGGDMKGARNALLAGGAFDEGMRLQSHLDAQAQRARGNRMEDMRMQWAQEDRKQALDERQLAKAQRLNGAFGRLALSVKNLPETERGAAWAQVVEQGRRLGADVAGFEDVSAIDRAIAQSMEMDEYLKYVQGGSKSGLMEVSPGATVYDPRLNQGVYTAPGKPKSENQLEGAKFEQSLRKEYTDLSKDFKTLQDATNRIKVGAQADSAVGDLSLIYGYMKLLDPGSVVRETEFATAENAQGVPDRIRNVWNRVINGERLSPQMRQQFVSTAEQLAVEQTRRMQRVRTQFETITRESGAAPERVLMDEGLAQQPPTQVSAPQPGVVEDGYRFKGGNPADPQSWEKVQ